MQWGLNLNLSFLTYLEIYCLYVFESKDNLREIKQQSNGLNKRVGGSGFESLSDLPYFSTFLVNLAGHINLKLM